MKGTLTLLDNFLFLDLNDTYQRVTLDVSRNAATESSLFLNQTDQNTATISPYLLWRLSEKSSLRTGYSYTDIRYWGDGIDRREQGAFARLNREVSSRLSLSADYGFTHLESQPNQYDKHDLSGGFRYEFAKKSFFFGQVGNSWQQFKNGGNASYLFWKAGITHDLGFSVATLATRVETAADPLAVTTRRATSSALISSPNAPLRVTFQEAQDARVVQRRDLADLVVVQLRRRIQRRVRLDLDLQRDAHRARCLDPHDDPVHGFARAGADRGADAGGLVGPVGVIAFGILERHDLIAARGRHDEPEIAAALGAPWLVVLHGLGVLWERRRRRHAR